MDIKTPHNIWDNFSRIIFKSGDDYTCFYFGTCCFAMLYKDYLSSTTLHTEEVDYTIRSVLNLFPNDNEGPSSF